MGLACLVDTVVTDPFCVGGWNCGVYGVRLLDRCISMSGDGGKPIKSRDCGHGLDREGRVLETPLSCPMGPAGSLRVPIRPTGIGSDAPISLVCPHRNYLLPIPPPVPRAVGEGVGDGYKKDMVLFGILVEVVLVWGLIGIPNRRLQYPMILKGPTVTTKLQQKLFMSIPVAVLVTPIPKKPMIGAQPSPVKFHIPNASYFKPGGDRYSDIMGILAYHKPILIVYSNLSMRTPGVELQVPISYDSLMTRALAPQPFADRLLLYPWIYHIMWIIGLYSTGDWFDPYCHQKVGLRGLCLFIWSAMWVLWVSQVLKSIINPIQPSDSPLTLTPLYLTPICHWTFMLHTQYTFPLKTILPPRINFYPGLPMALLKVDPGLIESHKSVLDTP
ncbi:hypothetical protein G9A89_000222 [Geosiphon pyriformis]|nr:hypothetical protein G9A89_000222 [Geosiphon pyriformis]